MANNQQAMESQNSLSLVINSLDHSSHSMNGYVTSARGAESGATQECETTDDSLEHKPQPLTLRGENTSFVNQLKIMQNGTCAQTESTTPSLSTRTSSLPNPDELGETGSYSSTHQGSHSLGETNIRRPASAMSLSTITSSQPHPEESGETGSYTSTHQRSHSLGVTTAQQPASAMDPPTITSALAQADSSLTGSFTSIAQGSHTLEETDALPPMSATGPPTITSSTSQPHPDSRRTGSYTSIDQASGDLHVHDTEETVSSPSKCTQHGNLPYVSGCKVCFLPLCKQCVTLTTCSNRRRHQPNDLKKLTASLAADEMRPKMAAREADLEKLFTKASKAISEFDSKTEELIALLHDTRDKQILAFNKLEEEFSAKRRATKQKLTEFLKDEVTAKWDELRNSRQRIEQKLKSAQEAEVLSGYAEMKRKVQSLIEDVLPALELHDIVELKKTGQSVHLDIEAVTADKMTISCNRPIFTTALPLSEPTPTIPPYPKSLTFLHSLHLQHSRPFSICCYKGMTYIGLESGSVIRIAEGQPRPFITTSGCVTSMAAYKNNIYILSFGFPWVISAHDLSGKLIAQWNHIDRSAALHNALAVISDQVIIPQRARERLTVYSLTGQRLRRIPFPTISSGWISMSSVGNSSLIVSDYKTSKVYRLDINTGDIIRINESCNSPLALTSSGDKYILLYCHNQPMLKILDLHTGEVMGKINQREITGPVYDLGVNGNTLAVIKHSDRQQILFYNMTY